jgi:hypothetical protein
MLLLGAFLDSDQSTERRMRRCRHVGPVASGFLPALLSSLGAMSFSRFNGHGRGWTQYPRVE